MPDDPPQDRLSEALFGEDHDTPSEYAMCSVGLFHSAPTWSAKAGTACAISVGGVSALSRKGGTPVPNEDCLYAFDNGRHVVHVVADGHHGHEASHDLVEALSFVFDEQGPEIDPLEAIESAYQRHASKASQATGAGSHPLSPSSSRTTLLIACLDREAGRLQGISIGDSPLYVGGLAEGMRRVVDPTQQYAAPWDYDSLAVPAHCQFSLPVPTGHWVVTCTDGVSECHYGKPESSIQTSHLETLMIRASGDTDRFVDELATLALQGVDGHPGGEDNFVILASLA